MGALAVALLSARPCCWPTRNDGTRLLRRLESAWTRVRSGLGIDTWDPAWSDGGVTVAGAYDLGAGGFGITLRLLDKFRLSPCRLHPSLRRSLALQRLPYLPHPLRKNSNYVSEVDRITEGRPGEVRQSLTPGAVGKILARRDAR